MGRRNVNMVEGTRQKLNWELDGITVHIMYFKLESKQGFQPKECKLVLYIIFIV